MLDKLKIMLVVLSTQHYDFILFFKYTEKTSEKSFVYQFLSISFSVFWLDVITKLSK